MAENLPHSHLSHYRMLSRLGAGGMGEVYLAEDTRLERRVAIKILPAAFTSDALRIKRFTQEARAASALNHPHIVTLYDVGESEAGRFLVMEVVEGRTMREVLADGCSVQGLVELGGQMALGLAAAHAAGIMHRDIKPDNIMVRPDGFVKILDFGLARLEGPQDDTTEPGAVMGTLKYMSPEQARGEKATTASDIYSLGMVFYEMATGRYPFAANSFMAYLHAIMTTTPGPAAESNPDVPESLSGLICRMLDKDASQRPTALEVAAALKRERPGPGSPAPVAAPRPVRCAVGRKPELRELMAVLRIVESSGKGALQCVSGEPGIGKSTFVEEFLAMAASEGNCTLARGRCSERLAGTEAYLPLLGALESLQPALSDTMKTLAPTWFGQVSTASSAGAEAQLPAASQDRLKRELGAFLLEASRSRPLLLFFDDLHWADVSTIDMIAYLASHFAGLRVLVLVTYRPSDMLLAKHSFLQIKPDLQARGLLRELTLPFLSEEEVGEYLGLQFPGHAFPAGFARLIHAKTEGSPLFMADLVRYLRDKGVIGQGGRLAGELPAIEKELPESVRGMIERKVSQLSEDDRKLLSVASVQGYEFDSAILTAVLGINADEVEERLENLERVFAFVRLLRETSMPNGRLTLRYRFVHVLYQNSLFSALRATRRAALSGEVAKALEACHGAKSGQISNEFAVLWEAARDFGTSAKYFTMAARQASQVFAEQEAAVLARRGLAALAQGPESPEQEIVLQVVLGVALRAVRGFSDAEVGKAFERARELALRFGQSRRLVPVLRGLWEYYECRAEYQKALPYGRELLQLGNDLDDKGVQVVACDVMGDNHVWLGKFTEAWSHLERGIGLYDAQRDAAHLFLYGYDSGMACCSYAAVALWNLGYPDRALEKIAASNVIAGRGGHPMTKAFAAIMAAWVQWLCGNLVAAEEEGDRAVAVSTEHGLPFFLGYGQVLRGAARAGLGKVDEGIADILEGLAVYRATGSELGVSLWLGCLASAYATAGRRGEAVSAVEEGLAFAQRTGEGAHEAELWRLRGELTGSLEFVSESLAIARRQNARSLELRAAMTLAKSGVSLEPLRDVYGWFTEGFEMRDLTEARSLLNR